MTSHRDAIVRQLELLLEASRRTREHLRSAEAVLRRAIKRLEQGEPIVTALRESGAFQSAHVINETLTVLERNRRDLRSAVIFGTGEEGVSLGQLAREIGVSRQLLQRVAKEAREPSP